MFRNYIFNCRPSHHQIYFTHNLILFRDIKSKLRNLPKNHILVNNIFKTPILRLIIEHRNYNILKDYDYQCFRDRCLNWIDDSISDVLNNTASFEKQIDTKLYYFPERRWQPEPVMTVFTIDEKNNSIIWTQLSTEEGDMDYFDDVLVYGPYMHYLITDWQFEEIRKGRLDHIFYHIDLVAYLCLPRDLTTCGDIEANPGPVHSKIQAQIGIEINHKHTVDIASIFNSLDEDIFDNITTFCEKAGINVVDKVEAVKNRVVITISLIFSIYRWSYGQLLTPDLVSTITTSLLVVVPASVIGKAVKMVFSGTTAQSETFQPQVILKALCVVFFLVTCSKLPGKGTIDEFIVRVRNIPQALKSLESLWDTIGPITKILQKLFEKHALGYDTSAEDCDFIGKVQSWADDVALYSDMYKKRLINRSTEAMNEAAQLHPRGIKLAQECIHNQYDRKNLELIRSLLATTFKISEFALKSGADQCSVRPEPVIVWFQGGSGNGKSTLMYPFIQDMMKATGIGVDADGQLEPDWQKRIYARMPETKFWSGYNPHFHDVIIIDEAFQLKDSALNPSPELFEIIRLGNMFPYMLYMDSIEQKANTFARAKLIVLTSNIKDIRIESLNCPEAVKRRISRAFTTNLKPKYRKYYVHNGHQQYMLDRSAVVDAMDLNIYEFQQFDTMTLTDVGPPMDYPIMLFECASVLIKNLKSFNRYDVALEENRTKPIPEMTQRLLEARGVQAQIGKPYVVTETPCFSTGQKPRLIDLIEDEEDEREEFFDANEDAVATVDHDRINNWNYIQDNCIVQDGFYACTEIVIPDRANELLDRHEPEILPHPYYGTQIFDGLEDGCILNGSIVYDSYVVPPTHRRPETLLESIYQSARLGVFSSKMFFAFGAKYLVDKGYISHSWDDFIHKYTNETDVRRNIVATSFLRAYDLDYSEQYEGVIFGQVGDDGEFIFPNENIRAARSKYDSWVLYFKKRYRELRFNLPALTASTIGLAILLYFNRHRISRLCQLVRPRDVTLKSKFKEMDNLIARAEQCARTGCGECKKCANVDEKDLVLLDYWGVTCKCYAVVCSQAKEKYKRLFIAYLDDRLNRPITTEGANAQMCDFVRTCVCEKCALCQGNTECECLRLAIKRGCTIEDVNLVDKTGLYDTICGQSRDPKQTKQTSVRVQSKDTKLDRQRSVKVQSKDSQTTKRTSVRVQSCDTGTYAQGNTLSQAKDVAADFAKEYIMNNVIYGSLLWMYVAGEDEETVKHRLGHVLMVKGRIALMNWHFITALSEVQDAKIVLRTLHGSVFAILKPSDIVVNAHRIGDKDACLVHLNKKSIQFRDLTKHFMSKHQRISFYTENLMLARYNITSDSMTPFPLMLTDATLRTEELEVSFDFQGREHSFVNPTAWEYSAPTVFGDCGSPLILYNSRVPTGLVGIHNARSIGSVRAFGVPLYREEIMETLALFPPSAQFGWTEDLELETTNIQQVLEGKSFVIMQAQKGQLPQASQSQVKPSPISGRYIQTQTKPGPLRKFVRNGVIIDPNALSRSKWGGIAPDVDPEFAAQADEVVKAMCLITSQKECREYSMPLTYEQAVVGIPGVPYIESINKMSSPGYPYVLDKATGKGKTGYFGRYEFDLTRKEALSVRDDVDKIERMYLCNERPFIVWIDTLKDQRIPIEKAEAGKTRVFSAGPMHYTILFRKHVLPFIAHLNCNRIDNMFGPGINPVSTEWHKLALLLRSKGGKCIAGDYKQWDGWAPTRGFESFYEAALTWYELHWGDIVAEKRNVVADQELSFDEYAAFFRNLVTDVISHVHLCNKELDGEMYKLFYLVTNGIPSGCPSTANTNSACNLWAIAYCYFAEFVGTEIATVDSFFRYVYAIFYGDDIAMNISDVIIERFNQVTLTDAMMRHFNLVFTDEAKTGDIVPYRTLSEISFLKRSFRFSTDIQLYVAPLPEDVLLDILNWVRVGGENPYRITIDNHQGVMGEMALLGREYYNKWYSTFLKTVHELSSGTSMIPHLDTYWGYLSKVRAGKLNAITVT